MNREKAIIITIIFFPNLFYLRKFELQKGKRFPVFIVNSVVRILMRLYVTVGGLEEIVPHFLLIRFDAIRICIGTINFQILQ